MGQKKTSLEINGKTYEMSSSRSFRFRKPAVTVSARNVLDGVVSPRKRPPSPAAKAITSPVKPPAKKRVPAPKARVNRLQKSKTLMRHAVRKPDIKLAPAAKPKTAAAKPTKPATKQAAAAALEQNRLARAAKVSKSSMISKFGAPVASVAKRSEPLPVKPTPSSPPPAAKTTRKPAPSIAINELPVYPLPKAPAKKSEDHIDRIQKALENAASKPVKPTKAKKTRGKRLNLLRKLGFANRTVSIGAMAVTLLLIGAYIAYMNVPNFAMRVAAARAGINASMPDYNPAGFTMSGPIAYEPGKIILSFNSATDNRSFTITQQESKWNSETLRASYVTTLDKPYQTYQEKGKTIYIYDNSNATWVDRGIWYQVEGNADLTSDQLLRIAGSL